MTISVATYNVKDLFDATSPETEQRLERKIDILAGVVAKLDADVIAFQEVSSEDVLRRLFAKIPNGGRYGAPLVGTADARGIRCAVVSRKPVTRWRVHTAHHLNFPAFYEGDPPPFGERIPLRRGVVHAEIDVGWGKPLHALVLHFKSSRPVPFRTREGVAIEPQTCRQEAEGMLRSLAWRACEALFVRNVVDSIFSADASAAIAVMGDFNDVRDSVVVRSVAGTGPHGLVSSSHLIAPEHRYSVLHGGAGSEIDHILVSFGSRLRTARFLNENLLDHNEFDDETVSVDSDHAPLIATFE